MVQWLGRVRASQPVRMVQRLGRVRASQPARGARPGLAEGSFHIVRYHRLIGQADHQGALVRAVRRLKVDHIVRHRATRGRKVGRIVRPGLEARAGLVVALRVVAVLLGRADGHKMGALVGAQVIGGLHPADQSVDRAGQRLL